MRSISISTKNQNANQISTISRFQFSGRVLYIYIFLFQHPPQHANWKCWPVLFIIYCELQFDILELNNIGAQYKLQDIVYNSLWLLFRYSQKLSLSHTRSLSLYLSLSLSLSLSHAFYLFLVFWLFFKVNPKMEPLFMGGLCLLVFRVSPCVGILTLLGNTAHSLCGDVGIAQTQCVGIERGITCENLVDTFFHIINSILKLNIMYTKAYDYNNLNKLCIFTIARTVKYCLLKCLVVRGSVFCS